MTAESGCRARLGAAVTELLALYARLDADLAAHVRPCRADGECCRFGPNRPILYVTTLEAACMAASGRAPNPNPEPAGACPYLDGDRCGIREHRALGCRTYYCDRGSEIERDALYEIYLRRLRAIEVRHGVPAQYRSMAEALADVRNAAGSPDAPGP